jgi:hypothetical protein
MTPEGKAMLFEFYNRKNFPHHIADSGSWMICRNDEGYCAAIPRDPASGALPSHFGDMAHVQRLAQQGYLTMLNSLKTENSHAETLKT